jgi:hypothetical protein
LRGRGESLRDPRGNQGACGLHTDRSRRTFWRSPRDLRSDFRTRLNPKRRQASPAAAPFETSHSSRLQPWSRAISPAHRSSSVRTRRAAFPSFSVVVPTARIRIRRSSRW